MTATVVTTHSRTPIAAVLEPITIGGLANADLRKRLPLMAQPAGQLWERVAEREPAYSIRLDCALQRADGSDCPESLDGSHRAYISPATGYRYCPDCEASL